MTQVEKVKRQIHKIRCELYTSPHLLHAEIIPLLDRHLGRFGARTILEPVAAHKNFFSVGGEFEIGRTRRPISLQIAISKSSDRIELSKRRLEGMLFLLFQILMHELRHKYQYSHRDPDSHWGLYYSLDDPKAAMTEEQEYLADLDEIDTYSADIAQELFYHCPHTWRDELKQIKHKSIQSYHYYTEVFAGTEWSDIRTQLLRKVYRHAIHIERTKGWF